MDTKKIDDLRTNLDKIDRQIIKLVAERQINVDKIGSVKMLTNSPIRNYRREKEVINNIRQTAKELNIDENIAHKIFTHIIEASLAQQESNKLHESNYGSNKKVLIIGGNGKMGLWFASFLASQGFQIEIDDIEPARHKYQQIDDFRKTTLNHDFIIVATPIQKTAAILMELADLSPTGIILDISSIKSPLEKSFKKLISNGCRAASIHPMFGPDVQLLSNRHVIFINVGNAEAINTIKQLFEPTMAERIDLTLEDHDRLIAYILGLSHIQNLIFATALSESGQAAELLKKLSSTTFDAQLAIAKNLSRENPHLYFEIQSLNPHSHSVHQNLTEITERLIKIIDQNNEKNFVSLMQQAQHYFFS